MKIKEVRTLTLREFPNLVWVEIATDEGLVGTGETFFGPEAVSAYVHETAAPYLIGKDPLQIEKHWTELYGYYLRFAGLGAETRAASAIDVALWDLLGQAANLPLYELLGGRTRPSITAYNTCAGYAYARRPIKGILDNTEWSNIGQGPYEDLDGFLNRADELACGLVEEGFTAMKMWPFDEYATASGGNRISLSDLNRGLEPFRKVRKAVGTKLEIALELHSRWALTPAQRIAQAAEEFEPLWYEDPLRMDNLGAVADFARSTRIPTIASELISNKFNFAQLLEMHVLGYVMFDFGWVGGISEARKIAAMADAYHLPVAPHDCTGPINLTVGVHFGVSQPNVVYQEVVRAYLSTWFGELVTGLPRLDKGQLYPVERPGIGIALNPDLWKRADAITRTTSHA